jgi:polyferredoxin
VRGAGSPDTRVSSPAAALRRVKGVHTAAWAFFAGCILAIPVAAWREDFGSALVLIAVVFVEVLVLAANGWSCPLTAVAARYTDDRRDNFDIYLPLWLARHNQLVFGGLFTAGLAFTLARWPGWTG